MLREIEIPPLWLALCAALGWRASRLWQWPLPGGPAIGLVLIVLGCLLMGLAAAQMLLAHTTVIPRRDPNALVTSGAFALSRNPIYVADALILAGLLLWWQVLWMIWLVPAFMLVITLRFIRGEEARLRAGFGAEYERYCANTRRWI